MSSPDTRQDDSLTLDQIRTRFDEQTMNCGTISVDEGEDGIIDIERLFRYEEGHESPEELITIMKATIEMRTRMRALGFDTTHQDDGNGGYTIVCRKTIVPTELENDLEEARKEMQGIKEEFPIAFA